MDAGYECISDGLSDIALALQDMSIDLYDRYGLSPVELLERISTCMKVASTGEVDFWIAWDEENE